MLIVLMMVAAAPSSCTVEHARYELRDDRTVVASFHAVKKTADWPTGLALEVHIGRSGHAYWFLPWQGGTNDKINLAWVRERNTPIPGQSLREDIEFFSTDAGYHFNHAVPSVRGHPPARLLLPELGHLLWYGTPNDRRDSVRKAFFDLTGCETRPTDAEPDIEFPPVP